jgi:hypothetical protein
VEGCHGPQSSVGRVGLSVMGLEDGLFVGRKVGDWLGWKMKDGSRVGKGEGLEVGLSVVGLRVGC